MTSSSPTGLGSGIDKERPVPSTAASGMSAASIRPARSRQYALVLVANAQRPDDTRRPRGDLGASKGAVSEELGRVEVVGEPGRANLASLARVLDQPELLYLKEG
jgi:hypothetical protein